MTTNQKKRVNLTPLYPWQYAALKSPYTHTALLAGVGSGKSFTGAHFDIDNILRYPNLTGFIGANNYDQLSTATLKELFYWLETYGLEFVIDRKPPLRWKQSGIRLKSFHNVLSVMNPWTDDVTHAFTRVLSDPNAFRGIEISWYHIDETRDTDQEAHDVLLSRMRESEYVRGLVTSTTNGEDWVYNRFVKNADGKLYGSIHAKTMDAVKAGILTQAYYDSMKSSYSELMAAQELDAEHVNVEGGRAYYAAGTQNKMRLAPWGPIDTNRPLIVGCDFNFQPSPCVWIVGQLSPEQDRIHWFKEISAVETSTENMTIALMTQFPDFFYKIFGDASGNIGTTSNSGITDYNRISNVLTENNCQFSIDSDQSNPHVKDRVENVNSLLKNALGEVRMTYSPEGCPLLDGDLKIVGWKQGTNQKGRGKLDSMGDAQRTHASDGAGYACFKLFPPGGRSRLIDSIPSAMMQEMMGG